ncbi:MAG: hypothetical protein U1D30_26100 [Planctomycetota bacterium]
MTWVHSKGEGELGKDGLGWESVLQGGEAAEEAFNIGVDLVLTTDEGGEAGVRVRASRGTLRASMPGEGRSIKNAATLGTSVGQ